MQTIINLTTPTCSACITSDHEHDRAGEYVQVYLVGRCSLKVAVPCHQLAVLRGQTKLGMPIQVHVQVYLASAAPPVRYPNVYGVDMPTRRELVAYDLTEPQICEVRIHDSFARHIARLQSECPTRSSRAD